MGGLYLYLFKVFHSWASLSFGPFRNPFQEKEASMHSTFEPSTYIIFVDVTLAMGLPWPTRVVERSYRGMWTLGDTISWGHHRSTHSLSYVLIILFCAICQTITHPQSY
jgi:hypothetical protein